MSGYDATGATGSPWAQRSRAVVRPSPLFLAVLAVAVAGGAIAWTQNGPGSRVGDIGVFLLVLGGWVVSVCLHEFGHAFVAWRAGDRSVEARGYLTLNPFKYAHPVLSILLPLVFMISGGIGMPGGAVYLHRHAFRSRSMQSFAAAIGPVTNAVLAAILLLLADSHGLGGAHLRFWAGLAFLGFLQVTAAVLNFLPIPGLDGWAIIEPWVDPATAAGAEKIKPFGFLIVFVLLLEVPRLNAGFFSLVERLYSAFGTPDVLWQYGYQFFRFWTKNPL